MTVYIVEDDENIRELVVYTLNASGFSATGFPDGKSFFSALRTGRPDLVLLDVMLPGQDGVAILKNLRSGPDTAGIAVIMLTAKSAEYDKITGLDAGADDYVTKPFGMMELVSRIRAVLRRSSDIRGPAPLRAGDVTLDPAGHSVTVAGEPVLLTVKEFDTLQCLMEHQGIVLTREQLLERIWGYSFDGETRTVDVHIRSLRRKLGDLGSLIETVRGVGYRIGRREHT